MGYWYFIFLNHRYCKNSVACYFLAGQTTEDKSYVAGYAARSLPDAGCSLHFQLGFAHCGISPEEETETGLLLKSHNDRKF